MLYAVTLWLLKKTIPDTYSVFSGKKRGCVVFALKYSGLREEGTSGGREGREKERKEERRNKSSRMLAVVEAGSLAALEDGPWEFILFPPLCVMCETFCSKIKKILKGLCRFTEW